MVKIYKLKHLLFLSLIFQIISLEEVKYEDKTIEDMKTNFWNSLNDGFYHLKDDIIPPNRTVIGFSDLNGDKYTDIITYTYFNKNYIFYKNIYDKDKYKFEDEVELFKILDNNNEISSVRNLYVGRLYGDDTCFLISFNKKNSDSELLHYKKCGEENPILMGIKSNILILNRNIDDNGQILFADSKYKNKKICKLGFASINNCDENVTSNIIDFPVKNVYDEAKENSKGISMKGGLAYVDINGDCSPDIILSYEDENNMRYIDIYLSARTDGDDNYYLAQTIQVGNANEYGAFTISRIKNDKDKKNAPQLDILIPKLSTNQIVAYKNKIQKGYDWEDLYCSEDSFSDTKSNTTILVQEKTYDLSNITAHNTLDNSFVTVIRPGDFLGTAEPGILVKQKTVDSSSSVICLYEKKGDKYELYLKIDNKEKIGNPKMAVFFDINEAGSLSLIVQNDEGKNHFFFNYRKNTFFLKTKLMNNKEKTLFSDINLGASFRYIVTDQDGKRHMEISYQLAQTSDMNIPIPYSLSGLGETNNYIENFQAISGNYYKDKSKFEDKKKRNFKDYTPIIPNTQIMIYKFKNNDKKFEWYIDLIVEPMESLIVIILVLIGVMLLLLGIVIYLHVREVKEEQKETNKFKSWFA